MIALAALVVVSAVAGAARWRSDDEFVQVAWLIGIGLVVLFSLAYGVTYAVGIQPSFMLTDVLLLRSFPNGSWIVWIGYVLICFTIGAKLRGLLGGKAGR